MASVALEALPFCTLSVSMGVGSLRSQKEDIFGNDFNIPVAIIGDIAHLRNEYLERIVHQIHWI